MPCVLERMEEIVSRQHLRQAPCQSIHSNMANVHRGLQDIQNTKLCDVTVDDRLGVGLEELNQLDDGSDLIAWTRESHDAIYMFFDTWTKAVV